MACVNARTRAHLHSHTPTHAQGLLSLRALQPLLAALLREARAGLHTYEPQHLAALASALGAAGVRPSLQWVGALVDAAQPRLGGACV